MTSEKMSSRILAEISRSDLADFSTADGKITNLRHVTSYNWLERPAPTIAVPGVKGSPPLWSPPSVPFKLAPDSGTIFIDQNAARNPRFPLEPLFRALAIDCPEFALGDVDLVTDRNNIRKLLRFVQGSSYDPFQIQVDIAGDQTALFTRMGEKTKETISGFRGYGHNFEKACTKASSGSTGHHRIVGYNFGGLKCLVRHETDGYFDDKSPRGPTDDLSDTLGGLSISKSGTEINPSSGIIVETNGKVVDLSSTLEIKTRAASRTLDMAEVSPQLWISQTPNLVAAYHRNGTFDNVQLRDMTGELRQWEISNQGHLRQLAGLLTKIIGVVRRSGDRSALVQYDGVSRLIILVGKGTRALPDDLYATWERKSKGGAEPTDDQKNAASDPSRPGQDATLPTIPDGTSFSDIIDHALRSGLRQFFRRMPTQLSDYDTLCEALQSRSVDVLAGRGVRDVMHDLREGKNDWDPEEQMAIKGYKNEARDSAFRLLYLILVEGWALQTPRDRNSVYNATQFVVSHPGIFKQRTRKMVRAAFEHHFHPSDNQRRVLDKWPVESEIEGEDVTTEDDSDFAYMSDDSF
ncbi:hypothetical protein CHGG_08598 [Chaetomium globosum CBS 148.51]|uniref:Uncharacterized protein n=1 Tax=Chaetomium globosum (strain ATCC 6205 / CBS 148.51 / DSM 1962 / NBRC 6347 / NRRL 1970) TaxID=306901 RepID=Q2GTV6_CHAGB|nr:uncharacterized protein CHGG_08598 [Chaetomium globosum CBS 148.51]EAQ84584.1 hypothetical protein CHGG_08598 [Chaetomium globosum CBS 148.51]